MLCRSKHDPLLSPEINDHIQPERLRGKSLSEWVTEGYIHQGHYWPFGRSEVRHEGETQVVGPFADTLWDVCRQSSIRALSYIARWRPEYSSLNHVATAHAYYEGLHRGRIESTRYPFSCVLVITVCTKRADVPGLLLVDLVGKSNAPGAKPKFLSKFMLRALKDGSAAEVAPHMPLSYGHKLKHRWIKLGLARSWLFECETRHRSTCSEHGWAIALRKPDFLRLLDVETLSIVVPNEPQTYRFIALSYVWGGTETVKLQFSNLNSLSKPGGLKSHLSRLPRTVLDAMEVVKKLDERYLWVDALCILQEDIVESYEQMDSMDKVYGSALLTIVAANGDNADVGLRGVHRRQFLPEEKPSLERQLEFSQPSAVMKSGVEIIDPTDRHQALDKTEWNTRAWTFQNRLLSRRLIIFAYNEMLWHCRCMIGREDMTAAETGYVKGV